MSNLSVNTQQPSESIDSFKYKAIWFLLVTTLFSWITWGTGFLLNEGDATSSNFFLFILIGSFGPSLGAIITTWRFDGIFGLKQLFSTIFIFRFHPLHYLLITLLLPAVVAIVFWLGGMRPSEDIPAAIVYLTVLISSINGLVGIFGGAGPLGEELGWRGYLLPLLLSQYSKLQTNLILGIIWALWHYPLIILSPAFREGFSIPVYMLVYPIIVIFITILMTNVWLVSRKSIFIAIWFHSTANILLGYATNSVWNLDNMSIPMVFALSTIAFGIAALLSELYVHKIKLGQHSNPDI